MLNKLFGKPAAAVPAPAATPQPHGNAVKPIPAPILEMRKLVAAKISNPFMDQEYVEPFFQGFVSLAWEYPASESGHHREPFGLIVHSLGTAIRMIDSATSFFKAPPKALADYMDKVKVHLFLCGVCHDLGKIMEWQVDTGGYTFDPLIDSLRTYHRPFTIEEKREGFGYKESAIHGVGLMWQIIRDVPKFRLSRDFSPAEITLISEAINCHHWSTEDGPSNNPYWRSLRAADVADIEAYEKAQIRNAAVQAATIVVPPMESAAAQVEAPAAAEAEVAREAVVEVDFAREALEQHLINAVRTLILERLEAHNNSYLIARQEGWLLLVAPVYVCDKNKARPGITDELGKIIGRNFDETTVVQNLFDLGLAVQVGADESRRYPNLKVETGGKIIDKLMFLPLIAAKFFSATEIDALPSCRIRNLSDFADPEFVNPEITAFYASQVKGKLKGDHLQAALKVLEVYDAEPDTPSVIEDDLEQEERDMPLWQHALEIARGAAAGAETGDYATLLVAGLAHDIGKAAAAENLRKVMSLDHAAGGGAFFAKLVDKRGAVRDAVMELIKRHHDEPVGLVAERVRAAHQGSEAVAAPVVVQEPEEGKREEELEGEEVVELVAPEKEPLPGVEVPF